MKTAIRSNTASQSLGQSTRRQRWQYLLGAGIVLALGYSSRAYASSLPSFIGSYAPDTLWALLIFLLVLCLRPQLPTLRAFGIALLFSYAIELSQLYQAPWINDVRATRLGGLLLGHGFLWSDLLCYTTGIALGALLDARFSASLRRAENMNDASSDHVKTR